MSESPHVLELVDDLLHGLLTKEQSERVQRHCDECRICEVALEEARARYRALLALPPVEVSEGLIHRTLAAASRPASGWQVGQAWAGRILMYGSAACVLVLLGLHVYLSQLRPTPHQLQVIAQQSWLSGSMAAVRLRFFNQRTREPFRNVPVTLTLHDPRSGRSTLLADYIMQPNGASPRFQVPDWPSGRYQLTVQARQDQEVETIRKTVRLERPFRVLVSTDKPVYQPGQEILVRCLALRQSDLHPAADEPVELLVRDPRGNVIWKHKSVSSRFGISSGECPLADEILLGAYLIECRVGDSVSRRSVEVREYVLPKFRVTVGLDQSFYRPGDTVRGRLQADYFFGQPVAGAAVELEVRRADSDASFFHESKVIGTTDSSGGFTFETKLRESNRLSYSYPLSLRVVARLVDRAGQEFVATKPFPVSPQSLLIHIVPEGDRLVAGVANRIHVYVTYPDGQPARCRVACDGWPAPVETNELGVGQLLFTPRRADVTWQVTARDAEGRSGERLVQLECGRARSDFLVRLEQPVIEAGQPLTLQVLGGGNEPIFVDLLRDGQTVWTETIEVREGQGSAQFDVPSDVFGTVQLCAYRFDAQGLPIRNSRILFIRQPSDLRVRLETDSKVYRPGETARVSLKLVDRDGRTRPGAVSLSAVDEAVYSVLATRPGLEQTFFLIEQELLRPMYAIYPWNPFSDRDAGAPAVEGDDENLSLEQVLFATTSQSTLGAKALSDPFTMVVDTYARKLARIQERRADGLHKIQFVWLLLAGLWVAAGVAWLAMNHFKWFLLGGAVCGLLSLGLLAMWSLQIRFEAMVTAEAEAQPAGHDAEWERAEREHEGDSFEIRKWFPETLFWEPEIVITDEQGEATVEVPLADSITTWRLAVSAVTADGQLAAGEFPLRVFQPFFVDINMPVSMTRGDEVSIPLVVYNYLEEPQEVHLEVEPGAWYEPLTEPGDRALLSLQLAPGEVRSVYYPVKLRTVGKHTLQVVARGQGVADAVQRQVEVRPDGYPIETTESGRLHEPYSLLWQVPQGIVPGSLRAEVRIYPSPFSQLVEGMEAIFRLPNGCFEQTSSTTYPNVLALAYLRRTGKSLPAIEAQARQYIHLGYQRLLTFEAYGGGFSWFGGWKGNLPLTAYGLLEFQDMAEVHEVDPELLKRTRKWLLEQREPDGSWAPVSRTFPSDSQDSVDEARLATTAYVAWATFRQDQGDVEPTREYLGRAADGTYSDPYLLALLAKAMQTIAPEDPRTEKLVEQLVELVRMDAEGGFASWQRSADQDSLFFSRGECGDIETTALATLVLLSSNQFPEVTRASLDWLVSQKDPEGTWHSTQATILSLQALLESTRLDGQEADRKVQLKVNGSAVATLDLPASQAEVVQSVDLSEHVGTGDYRLELVSLEGPPVAFQAGMRYHQPGAPPLPPAPPLDIRLTYDRLSLSVSESVQVMAEVVNRQEEIVPMVMITLPIPGGFAVDESSLEELKDLEMIAKYELTPRQAILYLTELKPNQKLTFTYGLQAKLPVKAASGPATLYAYYTPETAAQSESVQLEVLAR